MADRQYKAHLIQHEWVTTEVFDITAKDEKAAQAEAQKIVDTKELDVEYKIQIVPADGEPAEQSAPATPAEPEER